MFFDMENNIKSIATYGSVVRFKSYSDQWIVDSVYSKDGKIHINKLHDFEKRDSSTSYQQNGMPILNPNSCGIIINDVSEIEVIDVFDAIKQEIIYYNQFVDLNDRVVCLYTSRIGDKITDAISIAKLTGQTVLLQYCTNNDQRFYIPVVKEDWYFDVMVRCILYVRQLLY